MSEDVAALLNDPSVRAGLRIAWLDSNPGVVGGHEEGGFILRDPMGTLRVARWPGGATDTIELPAHGGCRIGDSEIVATFHTHPNTGPDYFQEPSETDRRAVRDDPELKAGFYSGELVVSNERLYLITQDGSVADLVATASLFDDPGRT